MKIIADLHTHSTYSHGKGRILDNVTAALAKGLKAIAIADHGPRSAPWVRATVEDFRTIRRECCDLDRRSVGLRVLAGAECNIISMRGDLDLPFPLRKELDIVLAGLHPGILPRSGKDWLMLTGGNWAARFSPSWRRKSRAANTNAVVEAVLRQHIDVITHPGYHLDIDTVELARACAYRDTALEINARHGEMTVEFCRLAAQQGARFVISSDAHAPKDVGNVSRAVSVARAAGLTAEQVLNADGGQLFEWLERKKARRTGRLGTLWHKWSAPGGATWERPVQAGEEADERGDSYWRDWATQGKLPH